MSRSLVLTALMGFGLAVAPTAAAQQSAPVSGVGEYEIKAAFLFRFLQLVEWPESAFASPKSPMIIGILSPDPFGNALEQIVSGEQIDARSIEIRRAEDPQALQPCHLLFVPQTGVSQIGSAQLESLPQGVLLVGESPDFLERGGMVNFYPQDKRIRFEIHPARVEKAGIRVRSRLLRLARVVEETGSSH